MEAHPKRVHFDEESASLSSHSLKVIVPHNNLHQLEQRQALPQQQPNIDMKYYQQFKKIYLTSFKLQSQIQKQLSTRDSLIAKISTIENQLIALHKTKRQEVIEQEQQQPQTQNRMRANKRTRRLADEIERKFYCQAAFCDRCYGSDGSLQQHIKLKHPELYRGKEDSGSI